MGDQPPLVHAMSSTVLNVMVADDEVQPVLEIELVKQIKDAPMSTPDVAEPAILPQLIAVPDLDIGKPVPEIVAQGMEKKPLVLGKDIRPAVVPTMAIAEKDDPGGIVKEDALSGLESLAQSSVCKRAPTVTKNRRVWL